MNYEELYNSFDSRIRDFEDSLSRLVVSAKIAYDKKHHIAITKDYALMMNDISKSELSDDHKGVFSSLIVELLNEAKVDVSYL